MEEIERIAKVSLLPKHNDCVPQSYREKAARRICQKMASVAAHLYLHHIVEVCDNRNVVTLNTFTSHLFGFGNAMSYLTEANPQELFILQFGTLLHKTGPPPCEHYALKRLCLGPIFP